MGQGTTYTAVVENIMVIPNIIDPGGGPDTDWFASTVAVTNGRTWPATNPCNPSAGHGPEGGFGHNMTLDATYDYVVPVPLTTDGVAHTVTITTTGVELDVDMGQPAIGFPPALCCENTFSIPFDDVLITKNFGP